MRDIFGGIFGLIAGFLLFCVFLAALGLLTVGLITVFS